MNDGMNVIIVGAFNDFFELFFIKAGTIVRHASLMTLKSRSKEEKCILIYTSWDGLLEPFLNNYRFQDH